MDEARFDDWLDRYGRAWQAKDAAGFGALFAEDASYQWTPMDPPIAGRPDIEAAFSAAVATQRSIRFGHQVLAVTDGAGICHWQCLFEREATGSPVRLDGIFVVRFDAAGRCVAFREWWHSSEHMADREGTG